MSTTTSTLKSNKNYHFGEIIGQYRSQPGTYEGKTFKNIDIYWINYWPNYERRKWNGKNKNKETDWKIGRKKSQIIGTQNVFYKAIKYTLKNHNNNNNIEIGKENTKK